MFNVDAALREENASLRAEVASLQQRVAWFEKQLFGRKSEKRLIEHPSQGSLLGEPAAPTPAEGETTTTVAAYRRGTGKKQRPDDCVNDSGLRFSDDVPVEVIEHPPAELSGPDADQYEIISIRKVFRLAQCQASFVVLCHETPVIKRKDEEAPLPCPSPANVLERSVADVSFLVGMLVDKFQYHLPLYRQHQRLKEAGITLSRATLTNLGKRAIELLRPIAQAQLDSILQSKVLAMDETPIKAGLSGKGTMKKAWFWPVYGDGDEVAFTYSASRGRQHIERTLKEHFSGVLISDGYAAYARYAEACEGITHAQCWAHTRRKFVDAEAQAPAEVAHALELIGELYKQQRRVEEESLSGEKKREYRHTHSKPLVDALMQWCGEQLQRRDLIPSHPLRTAINYTLGRETELRVFLKDPDVPLDTNHVERAIRPIPLGRKNWMFCWTELGAEHVGIIQSLISTCKLQGINPYTYLTDVLLRISTHPASQVSDLTPRNWKQRFADNPMRSDLYRTRQRMREA